MQRSWAIVPMANGNWCFPRLHRSILFTGPMGPHAASPYIKRTPRRKRRRPGRLSNRLLRRQNHHFLTNKPKNFPLPLGEGRVRDLATVGKWSRPQAPSPPPRPASIPVGDDQAKGSPRQFFNPVGGLGNISPDLHRRLSRPQNVRAEPYRIPPKTVEDVSAAHQEGKKVWAVGTTAVRALGDIRSQPDRRDKPGTGITTLYYPGLFISCHRSPHPPNFHMPGHTPLVLTAAFRSG